MSCPHCGNRRSYTVRRNHRKCARCRREWSPNDRYPISSIRLTRERWCTAIDAFLNDGTRNAVVRATRLGQFQARAVTTHIREVMTRDVPERLHGTSEADETYVGGTWRNKRAAIRIQGTKRGRGTSKQAIFGIVSREQQQVRVWLVPNVRGRTLRPIIHRIVIRPGPVYTDGAKMYRPLAREGYQHDWVDHDAGEYVRGHVHTQTMDGFWGLLKRNIAPIGGIRKRYLYRFIGEQVWRYNYRFLTREEQIERLLKRL